MSNTSFAAQAVAGGSVALDDTLRWLSVPAWLVCLACLTPAVVRLLRGRGRYLDPIWGVVFLLALNRLSFLFHISAEANHGTAALLALAMAAVSRSYQTHDR